MTVNEDLQASLERHNATFEALLNLIPAKYYLVQELSEEQVCSDNIDVCKNISKDIIDGLQISEK